MKIPMIIYRDESKRGNQSWIKYLLRRIKQNKNNLIAVIGATGSGKTWSAMSICEMISKKNNVYFGIENIVFNLKDLMHIINSGALKKGSSIIFDEPQTSISAREWQSKANRIFNYLLSTFRHRNLNLFFCTPYEDLLDKSSRKLFHSKFETVSINTQNKTVKIKPKIIQYNSQRQKFYECYLKICYKPIGMSGYLVKKLKSWSVTKPSIDLIKLYEYKKLKFTNKLNVNIERELKEVEKKANSKPDLSKQAKELVERLGSVKLAAKALGIHTQTVYARLWKYNRLNNEKIPVEITNKPKIPKGIE